MDLLHQGLPHAAEDRAEGSMLEESVKKEFLCLSPFTSSPAYTHWKDVGARKGLVEDEEIACFLLKYYEDTSVVFLSGSPYCESCGSALSVCCVHCQSSSTQQPHTTDHVHTKAEDDDDDDDDIDDGILYASRRENPQSQCGTVTDEKAVSVTRKGNQESVVPGTELPIAPLHSSQPPITSAPVCERGYLPLLREGAGAEGKPLFVNAKQYHRILKRREARRRLEASKKISRERQKYLHESRHNHAVSRDRGADGRYLPVAVDTDVEQTSEQTLPTKPAFAGSSPSQSRSTRRKTKAAASDSPSAQESDRKALRKTQPLALQAGRRGRARGANQFACDVCHKSFTRANNLKKHQLIHSGQKPFMCEVCSKAFTRVDDLKKHGVVHTGHKPYMCEQCGKSFTQAASLRTHKVIHTGLKAFVCDICHRAFTHAGNLKTHRLTHMGHRIFMCDECSMVFTRASNLKKHKMIHANQRPHNCEVCGKGFTRADELAKHRMVHTGERPHICDVCGKKFTAASILRRHQLIHKGQRPHVCEVCSKAFTEEGNLKRHRMIHTGCRPFVCEVCAKSFTYAGDLKKHRLIHTGERPFACNICSKTFTFAGSLRRHRLTHTEDSTSSILCQPCSKSCLYIAQLKAYTLTVPEQSFVCTTCGKTFTEVGTLFYGP